MSSGVPSSASSVWMWWVTVGGERNSSSAALVKLSRSATQTKQSSCWVFMAVSLPRIMSGTVYAIFLFFAIYHSIFANVEQGFEILNSDKRCYNFGVMKMSLFKGVKKVKTVLQQLKQYKRTAWTCIGFTALEVVMEILLPFVTARIIDDGLEAANLGVVYRYGALMIVMALVSLACGALAGKAAAAASSGLAANLRESIYARIQTFSFSNIDKFSVPGLVTRMTTDITNVQNAFMMVIRVAVRSPLTLVFSYAMCLYISPRLSAMFLIAVVFLVLVIGGIMVVTLRIFNEVFQKYDDLNASVQENISAIRGGEGLRPGALREREVQQGFGQPLPPLRQGRGPAGLQQPRHDGGGLLLHHLGVLAGRPLHRGRLHDPR